METKHSKALRARYSDHHTLLFLCPFYVFFPCGTFGVLCSLLVEFFELSPNPLMYQYSPLKFNVTNQAQPQPMSTYIHCRPIGFVPNTKVALPPAHHLPLLPLHSVSLWRAILGSQWLGAALATAQFSRTPVPQTKPNTSWERSHGFPRTPQDDHHHLPLPTVEGFCLSVGVSKFRSR